MDAPTMFDHHTVAPGTEILPGAIPVPGLGVLSVNAYVIRAAEPVLVDAGLAALREPFMQQLEAVLDLDDLRWIWITHTDPDHIGALRAVLDRAPRAKVITTFLGLGKLGMLDPVPPERIHLLNPGQHIDVGDRTLTAIKPPTFDAPETTALVDSRTGALFSSDCFGAVTGTRFACANDIPTAQLRDGVVTWTTIDAPWLHGTQTQTFDGELEQLRQLDPTVVLSSHLPPARALLPMLLDHLRSARVAPPFVGPDQRALMQMLAAVA